MVNAGSLKEKLLTPKEKGLDIGQIVEAIPIKMSSKGFPIVEVKGNDGRGYVVEVKPSKDQTNKIRSDHNLDKIVQHLSIGKKDERFRIIITKRYEEGFPDFFGECYVFNRSMNQFSNENNPLISRKILLAYVIENPTLIEQTHDSGFPSNQRRIYTDLKVIAVGNDDKKVKGYLKPVQLKIRPQSESEIYYPIVKAETIKSLYILYGNHNTGYDGLREGDQIFVRPFSSNNTSQGQKSISFFEPVLTIRDHDQAYYKKDIELSDSQLLITRITGHDGNEKKKGYQKGDIVRDLPIVMRKKTNRFGTVGIGFVPNYYSDTVRDFLNIIWVKGGDKLVGNIARESEIFFIDNKKGFYIAEYK